MKRFIDSILAVVRVVIGTILILSMVLICANAFGRYVLFKPIIWAEEVLGYALVWIVYLGAVLVTWDQNHLKMDLLSKMLTGWSRRVCDIAAVVLFVAAGALIIYQSVTSIASFTHTSLVAGIPMSWLHMIIPASFALMILCVLARTFSADPGPATGSDVPVQGVKT
ncbi:MAG: TRAP transporter small permease [Betaproteobacteria bacterium]|nr:TRAP transporter small permease [Betaproteobacteria bacterium]